MIPGFISLRTVTWALPLKIISLFPVYWRKFWIRFLFLIYIKYIGPISAPLICYLWDGYKIVNLHIESRHTSSKFSTSPRQHLACFSLSWLFTCQNNKSEKKLTVFCKQNFDYIALRLDRVVQSVVMIPLDYTRSTSQLHLDSYLLIGLYLSSDY
jgi:hypothetical protein